MRYFFTVLLLLPLLLPAQKLKGISYNQSKQKVIETYAVSIKEAKSVVTTLRLRSVGRSLFAYVAGQGLGVSNITGQDKIILHFENDSTVTLPSTGRQGFWYRDKALNAYQHRYAISRDDLELLSQYKLTAVQKSAGEDYAYISIPARYQERAKRLSSLFVRYLPKLPAKSVTKEPIAAVAAAAEVTEPEEPKTSVAPLFSTIKAEEAAQHIGDSVMICAKVYTARYLDRSKGKPTLINMGAPYPNQPLTIVIYEEDRAKFNGAPEEAFLDKEICVIGTLQLYNERPQIVVRRKEQITMK
ncbi:MAG TPA: hypothetical protein VEY10_01195 [Flavisolibacter sp.]|jgi:micrococcal nuclease|nr:hypothetical protein [Flavisolibacter sp.]